MKLIGLLFLAILFSLNGFPQYLDTDQPDSIYKKNHVKKRIARYEKYGLQNCNVNFYDSNGRFTERIMFDKSGKRKWLDALFEYDISGKLIKATGNSYMNHDKTTGNDQPDSILDSSKIYVSRFNYDSSGKLITRIGNAMPDKTPVATSYYYHPLTAVSKFYKFKDSLLTTEIIVYETPNIEKTTFSSYDSAVITKNTWQDIYQNYFDKAGRISKRLKGTPNDPSWCMEITYEYNANGLLIKKTERNSACTSKDCNWTIIFDYEYRNNNDAAPDLYVRNNVDCNERY